MIFGVLLRIALLVGAAIDLLIAILGLFFQAQMGPLLDVPVRDSALATFAAGEYLVVACVYIMALGDERRMRPWLLLCALDQALAVALPSAEILRGQLAASWKTIGPIPLSAVLFVIYVVGVSVGGAAPPRASLRPPAGRRR